jgi:hypothetical protein
MRNTILAGLLLLVCGAWAVAQSGSDQSGTSASKSAQITIEGCLIGSSDSFMLTDSTGAVFQLQGTSSDLSPNVGKDVQVKGTLSASSPAPSGDSPSTPASGSATNTPQTINVTRVQKVSDTCKPAK